MIGIERDQLEIKILGPDNQELDTCTIYDDYNMNRAWLDFRPDDAGVHLLEIISEDPEYRFLCEKFVVYPRTVQSQTKPLEAPVDRCLQTKVEEQPTKVTEKPIVETRKVTTAQTKMNQLPSPTILPTPGQDEKIHDETTNDSYDVTFYEPEQPNMTTNERKAVYELANKIQGEFNLEQITLLHDLLFEFMALEEMTQ